MKKNPVIPYALIAALGIVLVIVISIVGINQREAMENADEDEDTEQQSDEGEDQAEGGDTDDPDAIFEENCASCHGDDLSGDMGPNLQEVGGRLSQDEIK